MSRDRWPRPNVRFRLMTLRSPGRGRTRLFDRAILPIGTAHARMDVRFPFLIVALAFVAGGCDVSGILPASTGPTASVPGMFETIVAATAVAAQSQTATVIPPTPTPTWTPRPTHTPSLTPTLTPTFHFSLGGVAYSNQGSDVWRCRHREPRLGSRAARMAAPSSPNRRKMAPITIPRRALPPLGK